MGGFCASPSILRIAPDFQATIVPRSRAAFQSQIATAFGEDGAARASAGRRRLRPSRADRSSRRGNFKYAKECVGAVAAVDPVAVAIIAHGNFLTGGRR